MLRRAGQNFLLYSFLGWLLEGWYNRLTTGCFQKPNFLHGPFKPMYGIGGMLLAGSYRYDRNHFGYHCVVLPLLVEFCSGLWLKRRYQLRYWDYSGEFLQLGGLICLKFAFCWVVLAQATVRIVQPLLNMFLQITGKLSIWSSLFRFFFLDCIITMYQRRRACLQSRG